MAGKVTEAAVVDQNNKVLGAQFSPLHGKVTGRCWHG